MKTILRVIGGLCILGGFIIGIYIGNFPGFLIGILSGGVSSVFYFAIANIISTQEIIINSLYSIKDDTVKPVDQIVCSKCTNKYDYNITSCPKCGHRN